MKCGNLVEIYLWPHLAVKGLMAQMAHFKLYWTSTTYGYAAHVLSSRSAYFAAVSVVERLNCMRFWITDSWITQPTSWFYKNTIVSVVIAFLPFLTRLLLQTLASVFWSDKDWLPGRQNLAHQHLISIKTIMSNKSKGITTNWQKATMSKWTFWSIFFLNSKLRVCSL